MKKVMVLAFENMCDILQAALDNKYRTLPCSDPAAGSELLQVEPDALILELSLPGADGLAFLRQHTRFMPNAVLVLTPFVDDNLLRKLCDLGVSSVIRLPFRISYLESQLSDVSTKKNPSR